MASTGITAVKSELERELPQAKVRAIDNKGQANAFMDMLSVFRSNPPERGATEMLQNYSKMPWLRAVVDKVGSSIATMTWRVFVKTKTDAEGKRRPVPYRQLGFMRHEQRKAEMLKLRAAGDLVEIEDHPLIDSLYAVGPSFTGYTTRELTQKWLDLVGECFWLKERNAAGMPINFIPIPPHWIANTPTADEDVFKLNPPSGKQSDILAEDVIWFYHPNPEDPYARGSGMGMTLGDELETDEYAAKFMKTFFYNSARPDVLISSSELKKEDTTRLEKRWVDKLRGIRRSFLPFFMNRNIEVHPLGTDYSHLQMLDLRKNQRDAVIQVYGVPPETLGIVEASNRATSEVAEYLYARWVLLPRLEFLRQTLQHRLVPEYDDRLILDFDSPVAQDKEHILKVATIAPWSLYLDEWREMEGKLPLPDGKGQVFMKPLNYEAVVLDDLGEPYSQQDSADGDDGDDGDDGAAPVEPPADDDPPPEDDDEKSVRYVWPELIANQISRQRVSPRIGTRKDQVRGVINDAMIEIADSARSRSTEIDDALDAGEEKAIDSILEEASVNHAMDPVVAKLTSVYVLAADQSKANLSLFTEEGGIGDLEPLYELKRAKADAEKHILDAVRATLEEIAETSDSDAEELIYLLIDGIGVGKDDVPEYLECEGGGDEVVAMVSKFTDEMADHAIVHMCNRAQEALWSEAVKDGILDTAKVSRLWISRLGCRSCNECSGMDGTPAPIDGAWNLSKGGTVVSPTESHPECHCTEQLVRKEVQREAAE